jgi:DNA-binding NtrC family response regulator/pSer/pThr/pTyr-binding forkhead associated (FHA) protein
VSGGNSTTPRTSEATRREELGSSSGQTAVHSEPQPARLHVLVVGDKQVVTYPLPDTGEVRIGRSPQCEILVDDSSVSRMHATLSVGPVLILRDRNSANGTRVREVRVEPNVPVEITPGESIQVGTATVIVQRRVAPIRPRRLWTHDYFEVRLEEECARASRRGDSFAVLRIACESAGEAARDALTDLARLSDVVGEYGPDEFEMLVVDMSPEEIDEAVARLTDELAQRGVVARVGAVCFPRDGRSHDELIARAGATVHVPAAGGAGDRSVVVADRTMQELYSLAARVAPGTISVLILGETGVGKEVLAEKVHKLSPRGDKPYLKLNCAALSETLLESELFGHERGAFTGAVAAKPGLLETADGGSVFLDEVGELPLSTQVKLLRVIEERTVQRVGGLRPRRIDVRFIAATNRDLEAEIVRGVFRQDLFFRLNGATLVIPPLRERKSEVPELARAFLRQAAAQLGRATPPAISPEALAALGAYSWPGNIRELRNVIERAALICADGQILPRHLPLEKMRVTFATTAPVEVEAAPRAPRAFARPPTPTEIARPAAPERPRRAETEVTPVPTVLRRGPQLTPDEERARIEEALAACGGNQTRAAQMLGIARRTLINRLEEFGLTRPRKPTR